MDIIYEYLRASIKDDVKLAGKRSSEVSKLFADTLLTAITEFVEQNDLANLKVFNEQAIRSAVEKRLIDFGFTDLTTMLDGLDNLQQDPGFMNSKSTKAIPLEFVSGAVIRRLEVKVCAGCLVSESPPMGTISQIMIGEEHAKVFRDNFSKLKDLAYVNFMLESSNFTDVSLGAEFRKAGLTTHIQKGYIHKIYNDKTLTNPTEKDLAIIYSSDSLSGSEQFNSKGYNDLLYSFHKLPDTIRCNPILSSLFLLNNEYHKNKNNPLNVNGPFPGVDMVKNNWFYKFYSARHKLSESRLQDALDVTSLTQLSSLPKWLDGNQLKHKAYELITEMSLRIDSKDAILTQSQKEHLTKVANSFKSASSSLFDYIHLFPLKNAHDEELYSDSEYVSPLRQISDLDRNNALEMAEIKIQNSLFQAELIIHAQDYIENLSEIATASDDPLVIGNYFETIRNIFSDFKHFRDASVRYPFDKTVEFLARNADKLFDLGNSDIFHYLPAKMVNGLVSRIDYSEKNASEIFQAMTFTDAHYKHPAIDIHSIEVAKLLAKFEIKYPGFMSRNKIDPEFIFANKDELCDLGVNVFFSEFNSSKRALFNQTENSDADVSFLQGVTL